MVAIAARRKAAIVLASEEELHLTNIARLSDNDAAVKRAKILLNSASGKVTSVIASCSGASKSLVSIVTKQWENSELTGYEKVIAICFSKSGGRKKGKAMEEKASNVLEFNRRLSPRVSIHARSQAIEEMAKKEGMSISVRTVTRFLEQHEKQQLANV